MGCMGAEGPSSLGVAHLTVRAYWETARRGYRRFATYPGATFAGAFTNTVFGLLRGSVLLALLAAAPRVGGYDTTDALTYTWLTQALIATVSMWGWNELSLRIISGDIAVDLSRPLDLQASWLASDLGRAAYHAIFRGMPPFLVGMLLFRLRLPAAPLVWLAFGASVLLAVVTSFGLRFIVNLTAFWLLDYRGMLGVAAMIWTFLSGMAVPLAFLPPGLREVIGLLPFAGMIQVPIDVFLGKHAGLDLAAALALQAAWALALLGLGRVVLAAGVRKLVVQGG
jgi:ABC-2 type transport system permease protein